MNYFHQPQPLEQLAESLGFTTADGLKRSAKFRHIEQHGDLYRVRPGVDVVVLDMGLDGPCSLAYIAEQLGRDVRAMKAHASRGIYTWISKRRPEEDELIVGLSEYIYTFDQDTYDNRRAA
mgnify:CR=1 FL=1